MLSGCPPYGVGVKSQSTEIEALRVRFKLVLFPLSLHSTPRQQWHLWPQGKQQRIKRGQGGCSVWARACDDPTAQSSRLLLVCCLQMVHPVLFGCHARPGFPCSLVSKESACNAGDPMPQSGRSPEEGNGNPFQYSCLENPMDRGTWGATVHGVTRVRQDLVAKPSPTTRPEPALSPSFGRVFWTQILICSVIFRLLE